MINFGIIGTGWITTSFVAGAHATSKWNLSAVYSRSSDSAKHFASKYDQPIKTHTTISSLAADTNISAVYIASPNSLHFVQAAELLKAGKHVILEKPATSTGTELDKLFELAKENNVFLLEAYRHLHERNFKILQYNLPCLGPIYGASLTYAQYSSRYDKVLAGETPNIFSLEYSGGALVDLGVYCVAAAVALFGAPRESVYHPVVISTGADGAGFMLLKYEGFSVAINFSKIYNSATPSEVYGEKGTLVTPSITDIERVEFVDSQKKGEKEERGEEKEHLNLKEEAEEFARIIEEQDKEAARKWERISRTVVGITEKVRRDNGLLFKVEKEAL
ncbi:oxidoreductase-like protein [Lindgomyces ingoldianus]|uniref:Oxidoreductase-like protein n=1 Tax=Lindgomyces ingoldianus TaxID=673940 RepID=A0ACB6QSX2_9PLEO|nr:oxidoreductase-like protein [Lindgomyces ingoldianus]KAF2470026.1 oxidoreductase-like protein [Lindgomyces ingoldianus]